MIDTFLKYSEVPVTIQYYAKSQSCAKAAGDSSDQNDTRRARRCNAAASDTATIPEEVPVLNTNPYGTFTLDGKSYPLKVFVT